MLSKNINKILIIIHQYFKNQFINGLFRPEIGINFLSDQFDYEQIEFIVSVYSPLIAERLFANFKVSKILLENMEPLHCHSIGVSIGGWMKSKINRMTTEKWEMMMVKDLTNRIHSEDIYQILKRKNKELEELCKDEH